MAKRRPGEYRSVFLAWLSGCVALAAAPVVAQQTVALQGKNFLPVVVVCRADTTDQILGYVCRRIEADAPGLAAGYGMRLTVEHAGATEQHWTAPRDTVPLELALSATRPASQFGVKEITAQLSAPPIVPGEPPWSSAFVASGVPRDLVHPVADAALERIGAFLDERARRERDTSTQVAPQR